MAVAIYEFPLCEKVRNYLRLEQLFNKLQHTSQDLSEYQSLYFFDVLFTLSDLMERLDLRTDLVRDFDSYEKNLVYWSSHPNIDESALNETLKRIHYLVAEIKRTKKLGSSLKEDKFLSSIKQRFSIPGGAASFDLPNLFCWLRQKPEVLLEYRQNWMSQLELAKQSIDMLLAFTRESGAFTHITGENGFYQGIVEDKTDLIRVRCRTDLGYYPVLSGNKYRFGIKFMQLSPQAGSTGAIASTVEFELACC